MTPPKSSPDKNRCFSCCMSQKLPLKSKIFDSDKSNVCRLGRPDMDGGISLVEHSSSNILSELVSQHTWDNSREIGRTKIQYPKQSKVLTEGMKVFSVELVFIPKT